MWVKYACGVEVLGPHLEFSELVSFSAGYEGFNVGDDDIFIKGDLGWIVFGQDIP